MQGFLKQPEVVYDFSDEIIDNSTYANMKDVTTTHLHLNAALDFERKIMSGSVTLSMKVLNSSFTEVVLDSRYLDIYNISLSTSQGGVPLQYYYTQENPNIGSGLHIKVDNKLISGGKFNLTINYATTNKTLSLNWLDKSQTEGKAFPYVYTHCEAIDWRTLIPLQDTPSVKSTYSAVIQSPWNITVKMSANTTKEERIGELKYTHVSMNVPIPSYLIALAAGNLVTRQIRSRTSIITEPEMIDAAYKELFAIEQVIDEAEKFLPQYDWGFYNILVLPPSFPTGGMENPLLTFVSPTIIAGDKSQFDVAIHELSHSWSGNLVTNRNWENFWLNEGITVYLERNLLRKLEGETIYRVSSSLGNSSLFTDMADLGFNSTHTSLHPDYKGANPYDTFSSIPYEKGFQFMTHLENLVGQANIEKFLNGYFIKYRGKSVVYTDFWTTFQEFLNKTFSADKVKEINSQIDLDKWIFAPGKIPVQLDFYTSEVDEAKALAREYIKLGGKSSPAGFEKFNEYFSSLKCIFVQELIDNISSVNYDIIQKIDLDFGLTKTLDPEVKTLWYQICITKKYIQAWPYANEFMLSKGRMKYLLPLYKAWVDVNRERLLFKFS